MSKLTADDVLRTVLELFVQDDGQTEPFSMGVDVKHDSGQKGTVFFGYDPMLDICEDCGNPICPDCGGPMEVIEPAAG